MGDFKKICFLHSFSFLGHLTSTGTQQSCPGRADNFVECGSLLRRHPQRGGPGTRRSHPPFFDKKRQSPGGAT